MIVRKATPQDIPQLAELRWDFRAEHDRIGDLALKAEFITACSRFLVNALDSGRWTVWVTDLDGLILCNIYVEQVDKMPRPGRLAGSLGYVTNVYTRPEWRRQGIGSALLRQVQKWAREETGLELLVLWSAHDSVEFYRRAGFSANPVTLQYPID